MKKDKEWLKGELLRELMRFNDNPNMADYEIGIASGISTAINLTEKLDEPEQTDTNVGLSKPVIPDFMAYWIEENEHLTLMYIGFKLFSNRIKDEDVNDWISDNQEQFSRAFLAWPNVEVEKEKFYHIKLPTKTGFSYLNYDVDESVHFDNFKGTQFTEQEIKAIDKHYWPFAEEVTE